MDDGFDEDEAKEPNHAGSAVQSLRIVNKPTICYKASPSVMSK